MWIIIAIFAYLFNAVSTLINKILLTTSIPSAFSYTFYVSLLQLLSMVLIPFGFTVPSLYMIALSLLAGAFFTFSLLFLFLALSLDEATKVTTIIGGLQPIIIFIISYFFFSVYLTSYEFIAFSILVLGTILITLEKTKKIKRSSKKSLFYIIISALFFSLTFSLSDYLFLSVGFITGFVWSRFGSVIAALTLLLFTRARKEIFQVTHVASSQKSLFILNQLLGAASFLLLNIAIDLGKVPIISALQGVQFISIFILSLFLLKRFPTLMPKKISKRMLYQKFSAVILIVIGIIILSLKDL